MGDKGNYERRRNGDKDEDPPAAFSCKDLSFQTALLSTKPIAAQLAPATKLVVQYRQENNIDLILVVLPPKNDVVGSIDPLQRPEFLDCLKQGHQYRAAVLAGSTGGLCNVRILYAAPSQS